VSAVSAAPDVPPVPAIPVIHTIPRRPVASSTAEIPSPHSAAINALLLRPVSPIPQQTMLEQSEQVESRTSGESEGTRDRSNPMTPSRPPSSAGSLAQIRLEAPVPARTYDYHLTELLSSRPTKTPQGEENNVTDRNQAPLQIETSPSALSAGYVSGGSPDTIVSPSASQLARLNSRFGRPSSRVLGDPSRRGSSTFTQPQFASPMPQDNISRRVPAPNVPPYMTQQYPSAAAVNVNSPVESSTYMPVSYPPSRNLSWRGNPGPTRHVQPPAPTLRPRIQRLDTIHSVTSQGDQATHFRSIAGFEVLRKPSRAERSAALNIQQAKRRGWSGTRKSKKRERDGASSAGWTDVTRNSYGDGWDEAVRDKKGKAKCAIM
jgi:hypothetical protein